MNNIHTYIHVRSLSFDSSVNWQVCNAHTDNMYAWKYLCIIYVCMTYVHNQYQLIRVGPLLQTIHVYLFAWLQCIFTHAWMNEWMCMCMRALRVRNELGGLLAQLLFVFGRLLLKQLRRLRVRRTLRVRVGQKFLDACPANRDILRTCQISSHILFNNRLVWPIRISFTVMPGRQPPSSFRMLRQISPVPAASTRPVWRRSAVSIDW